MEQILNEKSKESLTDQEDIQEDIQEVNNTNVFDEIMPGSFEDRAFACIVGAFVGDACETVFEFQKEVIDEKRMAECMQMNGGGPFELYGGQVTDDSELAMCLLHGLISDKIPENVD